MIYKPYKYQSFSEEHIYKNKECALFMEMGLGKTVITLTAVDNLMYDYFDVTKVLVVAPKMVAEDVWDSEITKWDHLKHLRYSIISGKNEKGRIDAIKKPASIYVINREMVAWLVSYHQGAWPYDMMIIDELSSFKSTDSKRFKALRLVRPFCKRVVGLTGTPTGNNLVDLWPEMYLIDCGKRLGKTVGFYRHHYLTRKENGFGYRVVPAVEKIIYEKIGDICISMKTEDYLELPEKIERTTQIKLPPAIQKKYEDFERDSVLEFLDKEIEITPLNAAALMGKLLQFANGAVYDEEKNYHIVHDEKLDALGEIIEASEGQNILIFYNFRHDLERIQKKFKAVKLTGKKEKEKWNRGEIPLMIAHPAAAGHGLNLQAGGSIVVFFGLPWSLELYLQSIARLWRLGQIKPVFIYKLLCAKTVDVDVLKALGVKQTGQDNLMFAVRVVDMIIKKYAA
jgi:SNF2 family DNA or RNA helicase